MEYQKRYYFLLLLEAVLIVYVGVKRLLSRVLGIAPRYNSWLYDRLSACKEIRKTAEKGQTALSLNVVYNYHPNGNARSFDGWLESVWMRMPSAQAVRNRKQIVTSRLDAEVRRLWALDFTRRINIVFFAGGFVETGIAVAARAKRDGIPVSCTVLDISRLALDQARIRAMEAGVAEQFSFRRINLLDCDKVQGLFAGSAVHIVEMIGILDYMNREQAIRLFSLAKAILVPGGLLLTGNILRKVWEAPFLYTVINWPLMKHRSVRAFQRLLYDSRFVTDMEDMLLHVEPHGVFAVFEVRNPVLEFAADGVESQALQAL